MLTKDLLRYRVRTQKVYPGFIDPQDPELLTLAHSLLEIFENATTEQEVNDTLLQAGLDSHAIFPGLKKLLLDRCTPEAADPEVETHRWQMFAEAQRIRQETHFASRSAYQEAVAQCVEQSFDQVKAKLYQDLPQYRKLELTHLPTASGLLHRYNCALVQGLLLQAKQVSLEIGPLSLPEKRELLRSLKFHQLLVEFPSAEWTETGSYRLEISGPLTLFENVQLYGMKLASFFPRVLLLPQWKLSVELTLKGKPCTLEVSHKQGMVSHYAVRDHYVPPELAQFMDSMGELAPEWQIHMSTAFLHLGGQSYCCPDFTFEHASGQKVYLELFHRWHTSQLLPRVESLSHPEAPPVILGVCRSITRQKTLFPQIENSPWFQANGFFFTAFPRAKVVSSLLDSIYTR